MTAQRRPLFIGLSLLFTLTGVHAAQADPLVITSGYLAIYWQIDLPTFTICTGVNCLSPSSMDSVFHGRLASNGLQFFNAGDVVTPVGAGGPINAEGPLTEIVDGTTYQAFVSGSFRVSAAPFVAPPQNGEFTFSFATPFTMEGQIFGSADPFGRIPLFSVQVSGSGVETISGRTFTSGDPADYLAESFVAGFLPPTPTPEPATGVLFGGTLIAVLVRSRRHRALFQPSRHRRRPGYTPQSPGHPQQQRDTW